MPNSEYKLRYLPLFYEDLNEKVEYIAFEKLNPTAALKLVDAVEAAILERLPIATQSDCCAQTCRCCRSSYIGKTAYRGVFRDLSFFV